MKEKQENLLQQEKLPQQKRTRFQRILSWAGILLLLALYVITFVAAIVSSPSANGLFLASLTLTFVIPAAIYVYQWIRRVMKNK